MRLSEINEKSKHLHEANFSRRSFLRGIAGLASMGIKPLAALSSGAYDVSKFSLLFKSLPDDNKRILNDFLFMLYNDVNASKIKDLRNYDFRPDILLKRDSNGSLSYYAQGHGYSSKLDNYAPIFQKKLAFSGYLIKDGILYFDELGDANWRVVAPIEALLGYAIYDDNSDQCATLVDIMNNIQPEFIEKIAPGFLDDYISQIIQSQGMEPFLNVIKSIINDHGSSGSCMSLLKSSKLFRSILGVSDNFDTPMLVSKLRQHGLIDDAEARAVIDWVKKYGDELIEKVDHSKLEAEEQKPDDLKRRFSKKNEIDIAKNEEDRARYKLEKQEKESNERRNKDNLKYDEYLMSMMSNESGIGESRHKILKSMEGLI